MSPSHRFVQCIPPYSALFANACAHADMLPGFLHSSHLGPGQNILGSRPVQHGGRERRSEEKNKWTRKKEKITASFLRVRGRGPGATVLTGRL